MPTTDLLGIALVAPDKAKQFSSHGWCLVRLTYFTQMGLAGLIRLHMRRGPVSQEAFEAVATAGC